MFPIHDDTERFHGKPYVNYGLIFVNVVVFLWELSSTTFFTDPNAIQEILYIYGAIPRYVLTGDIMSIITSMFMHGGIAHLAGNMVFLFVFGDNIEDKFGHIKYLLIYLLWGALAAYSHSVAAIDGTDALVPAVGASGAISGILGAYLLLFPRAKIFTLVFAFFITTIRISAIAFLPIWFVMQIVFGILFPQSGGVAYFAHIGGFVAGFATAYAWKRIMLNRKLQFRGIPSHSNNRIPLKPTGNSFVINEPEIIRGPDFYEVIIEIRGISNPSDIKAEFEPKNTTVKIGVSNSIAPQVVAKLPADASIYKLQHVDYLNGIVRVRLS
jgi:membrane associated rhomboid family serine protease